MLSAYNEGYYASYIAAQEHFNFIKLILIILNKHFPIKKIYYLCNMKIWNRDFIEETSKYRSAIMGLSMLSIMLFHQYFTSSFPFNIFHNIGFWGVDIFLFLSGMGLVNSIRKNTTNVFYKRRFKRLIPSCIICGITKLTVFILLGSSVQILKEGLNIGIWSLASLDLWFIHTIIILYIISPLLYRLLLKWPYLTISIILTAFIINGLTVRPMVGFKWLSLQGIISWTIERLPVFTAGMFMSIKHKERHFTYFVSICLLIIALILNLQEKTNLSFHGIQACQMLALTISMPALIILCTFIITIIPNSIYKVVVFLGTYSLELYLTHEFIFWTIKISCKDVNPIILLLISFILSCIAAYLCKVYANKLTKQYDL